jgi:hypothetical protein
VKKIDIREITLKQAATGIIFMSIFILAIGNIKSCFNDATAQPAITQHANNFKKLHDTLFRADSLQRDKTACVIRNLKRLNYRFLAQYNDSDIVKLDARAKTLEHRDSINNMGD